MGGREAIGGPRPRNLNGTPRVQAIKNTDGTLSKPLKSISYITFLDIYPNKLPNYMVFSPPTSIVSLYGQVLVAFTRNKQAYGLAAHSVAKYLIRD